jgi:hypothetical protein
LLFCTTYHAIQMAKFIPERNGNNSITGFWLERAWLFYD